MAKRPATPSAHAQQLSHWLKHRLTGKAMRAEWPTLLQASWRQLLQAPFEQVAPRDELTSLVVSYLEPERIRDLVKPTIRIVLPQIISTMRADKHPVSRWVPAEAKERIRKLVSQPGLVNQAWIKTLFRQKAVEEVMADVLYRGIRDFSSILPRVMLGLLPTSRFPGLGGAGAMGKRILDELEKRIEPEIRPFLASGTQRALSHAADFAIERLDAPPSVVLRQNVVDFVLSQSPSFHVEALSDELLESLEPIVDAIATQVASMPESSELAHEIAVSIAQRFAGMTVGDVLQKAGIQGEPDFDALADATWPLVRNHLEAPEVNDWLGHLVEELLAQQLVVEKNPAPAPKKTRVKKAASKARPE